MARQIWKMEPTDRWIRGTVNGETVVDSKHARLMIESPGEVDYYFPLEDVRVDLLEESEETETSGYRGTRKFWDLRQNGQVVKKAAWTYESKDKRPDFSGYLAFDWKAMDHWFEEEEEVFLHARNPYHRIDTIKSSRHVKVFIDGVKIADTNGPFLLFETSLPTRYYIPLEDVEQAYLTPTDTHSVCPYKGTASYYSMTVNGETYKDIIWTYPEPIPEAPRLKGTASFWPEKDKRIQIFVDGEKV
jgi:uncharacterized protein (DUF427 family)